MTSPAELISKALNEDNNELFLTLISHVDINLKLSDGNTLLQKAIVQKRVSMIEKLIELKADVNAVYPYGESVLTQAILKSLPKKIIMALIAAGADVNYQNVYGNTCSRLLLIYNNVGGIELVDDEVIDQLLQKKANFRLVNRNGSSTISILKHESHPYYTKILEKYEKLYPETPVSTPEPIKLMTAESGLRDIVNPGIIITSEPIHSSTVISDIVTPGIITTSEPITSSTNIDSGPVDKIITSGQILSKTSFDYSGLTSPKTKQLYFSSAVSDEGYPYASVYMVDRLLTPLNEVTRTAYTTIPIAGIDVLEFTFVTVDYQVCEMPPIEHVRKNNRDIIPHTIQERANGSKYGVVAGMPQLKYTSDADIAIMFKPDGKIYRLVIRAILRTPTQSFEDSYEKETLTMTDIKIGSHVVPIRLRI